MTVPAHNLYDFIYQATERRFLMFYFYPWGEKDFSGVKDYQINVTDRDALSVVHSKQFFPDRLLGKFQIRNFQPVILCHDQEPLCYDYYTSDGLGMTEFLKNKQADLDYPMGDHNLRSCHHWSMYKRWILLHSEKNSQQLKRYEDTGRYIGAFWWSHAMLARDWYRFAQYDKSLQTSVQDIQMFLIYARDCTGSREYRRDFLSAITDIQQYCQIGSVKNLKVSSESSAIYEPADFTNTSISVVLETMFADDRIHLTEKILRPIACGHPFILASGPGSLNFLKSYGFETFHPCIDERYDDEKDHATRLAMIVKEMQRLTRLTQGEKKQVLDKCREIAEKNKNHFFSHKFQDLIVNELQSNVEHAWQKIRGIYDPQYWLEIRRWRKRNRPEYFLQPETQALDAYMIPLIKHMRSNQGSLEQYQRHDHGLDDESGTNCDNV